MERRLAAIGAVAAFLAVAAGAFGAHGLGRAWAGQPDRLATWETAVRYHLFHSLALLAAAWAVGRLRPRAASAAGWLFLAGIVLFSGSLYALAATEVRSLAFVTPVGGTAFLAGWVLMLVACLGRSTS